MKSIFEKLRHLTTRARCDRKECKSGLKPTKVPVVAVWASYAKTGEPACFVFANQKMCGACAQILSHEYFVSHEGQMQLGAAFEKSGKPLPRWETAEIRWRDA